MSTQSSWDYSFGLYKQCEFCKTQRPKSRLIISDAVGPGLAILHCCVEDEEFCKKTAAALLK